MSAEGAIVFCPETGEVLYGKNIDEKLDPLSTTKVMTVYLVMKQIEKGKLKLDDMVTVTKEDTQVPESKLYLEEGEKISVRSLIYGAMLYSGNDAAAALGSKVAGNKAAFAKLMNSEAAKLGCMNTTFKNANGLIVKGLKTTPRDMALIARACFSYEFVQKVCQTKKYKIPPTNKYDHFIQVELTNPFFSKQGNLKKPYEKYNIVAGKTGTWDIGNASLLEMAEYKNKHIITVVMNDLLDQRYPDSVTLIEYGRKVLDAKAKAEADASKSVQTESGSYPSFIADSKAAKRLVKWANRLSENSTAAIRIAEYGTDGDVLLKWSKVSGARGYKIFRSEGGAYKLIDTIKSGSNTEYVDRTVKKDHIYHYYVRGTGRGGGLILDN